MIFIIFCVWVFCGLFACGFTFAYFQRKYPSLRKRDFISDQNFSTMFLIGGPVGLITALNSGNVSYGWLWPWSGKARKESGMENDK